jgi:alkylation response protein AidB-like acyl-CoA dehydrogenase
MQIYKTPTADMRFMLEAFDYDRVHALEKYRDFDIDTAAAIVEQAANFATEVWLPLNRSGDRSGLVWDAATGAVTTPEGFKNAYAQMVQNGYSGITSPAEFGGTDAPLVIGSFFSEIWTATNKSLSMCPGLSSGLIEALERHGSDQLKEQYLAKLISGEWAGTMCLTEAHCGTDLGLLRTKAVPNGDGYKITGTKIWITFGEHDLTENIVHLVLARLPGAPEGVKGISTFIVPKITLDGKPNNVRCTGLEHKMGIHASPTCVIDFEDATGYLVGEPHRGMRAMFTMMNGARLMVANEGIAFSEIAYQTALAYAKDRRQMRALDPAKRDPDHPADTILVHPDVRRMLLNVKSTLGAMRGLSTFVAVNIDVAQHHADAAVRQDAEDLVALLTPVVKSYFTERGFANVSEAMQVCGGAGYTVDWSIEQYLRDSRISMIYEGTNHIQALDLVGRKLPRNNGRAFGVFAKLATRVAADSMADERTAPLAEALISATELLTSATMELGAKATADPEEAGAGASNYLNVFALAALQLSWVKQVKYALDNDHPEATTKLKLARYFSAMVLPEQKAFAEIMRAGKQHMMAFDVDEL